MAYIIGLLTEEEERQLTARGWEVEPAPKELIFEDTAQPDRMRMVWCDVSMFDVMSGPDWTVEELEDEGGDDGDSEDTDRA